MPPQAAGLDTLRVASNLVGACLNRRSTGRERQSITGILACRGALRYPGSPALARVADVDTGVINWVNADLVTNICPRV